MSIVEIRPAKPREWYDEHYAMINRGARASDGTMRPTWPFPAHAALYETVGRWLQVTLEALRTPLEERPPPHQHLIDYGCGAGHLAAYIRRGHDYYGYDWSRSAVELAQNNNVYARYGLTLPHCFIESATVWAILEVLEHVDVVTMAMILDLVAPGAVAIVSVPNFDSESHARLFETSQDLVDVMDGFEVLKLAAIEVTDTKRIWVGKFQKHVID